MRIRKKSEARRGWERGAGKAAHGGSGMLRVIVWLGLQEAAAEQLQSWDLLVTVPEGLVLEESGGSPPNSVSWWPGGVGDSAESRGECVIRIRHPKTYHFGVRVRLS